MAPLLANPSTSAVADAALENFAAMFPGAKPALLDRVFADVAAMFAGHYLDYQKIDTPYHDLQHTLQVTMCLIDMLSGRHGAGIEPPLSPRQFELAVCAALLHDTGYLKLRADLEGTGAKYTFTHVLRSCAVASSYLPTVGVSLDELDGVLGAIRCTNPTTVIRRLHFQHPIEGIVGCAVATADYIGQMSAPNYLAQLPLLFAEFEESDNFAGVPMDQRAFRSVDDLIAKTPLFWNTAVMPKLENELLGLYRFLARPYPDGPNAYIESVNQNVAAITAEGVRRSQTAAPFKTPVS
ncbi:MAG TPA: HD domain-containing protein [Opitutaceae bacterium]|nr:HD domain-containing protein [Opitutaceae bacterium]